MADETVRLYNEVNYERMQQFFQQKRVDFKGTWDKFYEKHKGILGPANAQAVVQKNNEVRSSFFSSLKDKVSLPSFVKHASPPGYWKDKGKRRVILVVRQDSYEDDEEKHVLILKDWKMEIPFAGRLR
ncbi:hypothetical protein [Metallosphaera tengchongensis]|uniref:hypothetical protein n=1 Tax=Metallosphaera tengchongensis TaxID=1532350 RepID=UPI001FE2D44A|nr:hypothetical protein [Metallosphaera tengchongensis]